MEPEQPEGGAYGWAWGGRPLPAVGPASAGSGALSRGLSCGDTVGRGRNPEAPSALEQRGFLVRVQRPMGESLGQAGARLPTVRAVSALLLHGADTYVEMAYSWKKTWLVCDTAWERDWVSGERGGEKNV